MILRKYSSMRVFDSKNIIYYQHRDSGTNSAAEFGVAVLIAVWGWWWADCDFKVGITKTE